MAPFVYDVPMDVSQLPVRRRSLKWIARALLVVSLVRATPGTALEDTPKHAGWPARIVILSVEAGEGAEALAPEALRRRKETRKALRELTASALELEGRTRVITRDDLRALLSHEASRQLLAADEAGATRLGAAVEADYVVTVRLLDLPGGAAALVLHAIDPVRGASVHRERSEIGIADDFSKVVTQAAKRLLDAIVAQHGVLTGGMPRERSWLARRGPFFWGAASGGAAASIAGGLLLGVSGRRAAQHNRAALAYQRWIDGGMVGEDRPEAKGLLSTSEQARTRQLWAAGWVSLGSGVTLIALGALFDRPLPRFVNVSLFEDPSGGRGVFVSWGGRF